LFGGTLGVNTTADLESNRWRQQKKEGDKSMKGKMFAPLLTIGAMMMAALFASPREAVHAQTVPPAAEPPRSVTVSGTGRVSSEPDVAVITIGVETNAEDAGTALAQNNEQMQALIETLQAAGVAEEDIQTQSIQLYSPDQTFGPPPPPQPEESGERAPETEETEPAMAAGYRAINLVEVRVRNLAQVGELINQAVQAGGNQIQGIRFELSDPQAALEQARQEAWEEALQKAEQWAELTGDELGEVLTINEYQSAIPYAAESALARGGDIAAVPVEPGTQIVQLDVQVSWRLE
jgi:uncharacterized protein YggE